MSDHHKLKSGDIYKHGKDFYLALMDENKVWHTYVWSKCGMFETAHWWDDNDSAYEKKFILNISNALNTVFNVEGVNNE